MAGRKVLAITERQFSVLRVLWEQGPLTVRQLMEHLPGGKKQPYTTVLGLLQAMEKASLVAHEKEGTTHRYVPLVSRGEATGSLLSDFIKRFFHGSAEQLVLGLVDTQALDPKDLASIEAKLNERSAQEERADHLSDTPGNDTTKPKRRRKAP